jgi:hypothetical protein
MFERPCGRSVEVWPPSRRAPALARAECGRAGLPPRGLADLIRCPGTVHSLRGGGDVLGPGRIVKAERASWRPNAPDVTGAKIDAAFWRKTPPPLAPAALTPPWSAGTPPRPARGECSARAPVLEYLAETRPASSSSRIPLGGTSAACVHHTSSTIPQGFPLLLVADGPSELFDRFPTLVRRELASHPESTCLPCWWRVRPGHGPLIGNLLETARPCQRVRAHLSRSGRQPSVRRAVRPSAQGQGLIRTREGSTWT